MYGIFEVCDCHIHADIANPADLGDSEVNMNSVANLYNTD